jgi:hypothetical protein
MNVRMPVVARPGPVSGRITRVKLCHREAPSTIAASSRSGGSWRKNPTSSQTASGMANVTYGSTSPGYVLISRSDRRSMYSGLTMEICGNIVTARMKARIARLPANSRRASA